MSTRQKVQIIGASERIMRSFNALIDRLDDLNSNLDKKPDTLGAIIDKLRDVRTSFVENFSFPDVDADGERQ